MRMNIKSSGYIFCLSSFEAFSPLFVLSAVCSVSYSRVLSVSVCVCDVDDKHYTPAEDSLYASPIIQMNIDVHLSLINCNTRDGRQMPLRYSVWSCAIGFLLLQFLQCAESLLNSLHGVCALPRARCDYRTDGRKTAVRIKKKNIEEKKIESERDTNSTYL